MVQENKNVTYLCIGIYIFKFNKFLHDEVFLTSLAILMYIYKEVNMLQNYPNTIFQ